MSGFLAPAIKLMNMLSYAQKFGVISFTFFVPLLLLSYAIIDQTYQQIEKTKLEQSSLHIINEILEISDQATLYRDVGGVASFFSRPEINDEADKLSTNLFKGINSVINENLSSPIADELESKKKPWRTGFDRSGESRQPTINDQYKGYNQVVQDMIFSASKAAQASGINQDTDANVQILLNMVMSDYPVYQANMGFANTLALYAIFEKYISTEVYNSLNDAYDGLDQTQKDMAKNHKALLNNERFKVLFEKEFINIEKSVEEIKFKLDDEIVSAMTVEITWRDFRKYYLDRTGSIQSIRKIALDEISAILQVRIDELSQKLAIVAVAIILVMLLIVYLYAAFFWSVRSTVGQFFNAAQKISRGDMRVRVNVESKDEMGELTGEFNVMVDKIHSLLKVVQETASDVGNSMDQVGKNAAKSNDAAHDQLLETEQVASAVTQMSATSEEVNRQSSEAERSANETSEHAKGANEIVGKALNQINQLADEIMHSKDVITKLSENSENIANMLSVIKGIAEQTNLLALNAAIEAARAGEQGRGFAVVADEVRTLASRTQSSAQEIEEVMTTIHTGITNAVEVMGNSHMMAQDTVEFSSKVRTALEEIVDMVGHIATTNGLISTSADEQTNVAQTIDKNVVTINDLGRATVEDAKHTVEAIQEVVALTQSLQEKLERFQV